MLTISEISMPSKKGSILGLHSLISARTLDKQAHVKCNLETRAMPNALHVSESILNICIYSHKFLYVMERGITGIIL